MTMLRLVPPAAQPDVGNPLCDVLERLVAAQDHLSQIPDQTAEVIRVRGLVQSAMNNVFYVLQPNFDDVVRQFGLDGLVDEPPGDQA